MMWDIAVIFHEGIFALALLFTIGYIAWQNRRFHVPHSLSLLLILITTFTYLITAGVSNGFILEFYPAIKMAFPHADKLMGIFITMIILWSVRNVFRLPSSLFYSYFLVLLPLFVFTNLACLTGHHVLSMPGDQFIHLSQFLILIRENISQGLVQQGPERYHLIRIFIGILAMILYLIFCSYIRKTRSRFLLEIILLLTAWLIQQFYIPNPEHVSIYERLLGMNMLQWAFLSGNLFCFLLLFISEAEVPHKKIRRKIRRPSLWSLLMVYFISTLAIMKISAMLVGADLIGLITVFSIVSFSMVVYFYLKINHRFLRYAILTIFLLAGIFLTGITNRSANDLPSPKEIAPRDQEAIKIRSQPINNQNPYAYQLQNLPDTTAYDTLGNSLVNGISRLNLMTEDQIRLLETPGLPNGRKNKHFEIE